MEIHNGMFHLGEAYNLSSNENSNSIWNFY